MAEKRSFSRPHHTLIIPGHAGHTGHRHLLIFRNMHLALLLLVCLLGAAAGCRSDEVSSTAPRATTTAPTQTPTTATPPRPVRIMPLGDSITQGDSDHNTYRRPLWKSLEVEGFRVDFVGSLRAHHRGAPPLDDFDRDHEGHWGWRADEVLDRIRGWIAESEPDVILIHLGSNDLFQNESIESTLSELSEIIDAVRETRPEATFLLAQIIPTTTRAANARIFDLNARIPELAASKSKPSSRVIVVDQHSGFDAARQTYDGVHPNPDGEIHLSERWLEALEEILPR
jgi:lysophospholipase L1-like esterase